MNRESGPGEGQRVRFECRGNCEAGWEGDVAGGVGALEGFGNGEPRKSFQHLG